MKFHAPSTILLYEMEDGSNRAKDKNRESCGQKLAHYTSDPLLRPTPLLHEMELFFLSFSNSAFQIGYWAILIRSEMRIILISLIRFYDLERSSSLP